MAQPDESLPAPTAYCAPGREEVARLVLWVRGDKVSGVTAHPWLAGWDGIMLVAPPGEWPALEIGDLVPLSECGWQMPGAVTVSFDDRDLGKVS